MPTDIDAAGWTYESVADELVRRILALIPAHPEVATLQNEWDLTKIPEFVYKDLEPTFYQVSWALRKAQQQARAR